MKKNCSFDSQNGPISQAPLLWACGKAHIMKGMNSRAKPLTLWPGNKKKKK
jgi:hypothetical protein